MLPLDTCTLLWLAADQDRLSKRARVLLAARAGAIFVSAISAFEIGVKSRRRALSLPLAPAEWFARALDFHGIREIAVSGRIAVRSTQLPLIHSDPCDRIIVVTAQIGLLTVLTPDPLIRAYPGIEVEW